MKMTIDEKKQALKGGKKGIIFVERTGGLRKRLGFTEYSVKGLISEPYDGEGIILKKEGGGEKRIPYEQIVDFVPYMSPPDIKKILKVGWKGTIILLNDKKKHGFVGATGEEGVVLAKRKKNRKGRYEPEYSFVSYSEIKFPRNTGGVIVVDSTYRQGSEEFLKNR